MANSFKILIPFLALLFACQITKEDGVHIAGENLDYQLIRDDLYEDKEGNLYFRTIDRSAADNPEQPELGMKYSYNKYLYVDSLVDGNTILTTPAIKDVVDAETFHKTTGKQQPKNPDGSSPLSMSHYADKNKKYFLLHVADGGVLHKK